MLHHGRHSAALLSYAVRFLCLFLFIISALPKCSKCSLICGFGFVQKNVFSWASFISKKAVSMLTFQNLQQVRRFVSFSGSRSLLPGCPSLQVAGVLLAHFGRNGAPLATGCCPSGLDFFARLFCASNGFPLSVFSTSIRSASALRARTLRMVSQSAVLFVFPVSSSFAHSGSWLSAFSAAAAGLPCFVFLPGVPGSALPLCRGVVSWQQIVLFGHNFWQPIIQVIQKELEF